MAAPTTSGIIADDRALANYAQSIAQIDRSLAYVNNVVASCPHCAHGLRRDVRISE